MRSERITCVLGIILELAGNKCRRPDCFSVCNKFSGCTLIIKGLCQRDHYFQWTSSNAIKNKIGSAVHEDNMLFSIAVVLSGNNFQKIEHFSSTLGLHVISWSTFHMYQWLYICPGIEKFYFKAQVHACMHRYYIIKQACVFLLFLDKQCNPTISGQGNPCNSEEACLVI